MQELLRLLLLLLAAAAGGAAAMNISVGLIWDTDSVFATFERLKTRFELRMWDTCPDRAGSLNLTSDAFPIPTLPTASQLQMLPAALTQQGFLFFGTKRNSLTPVLAEVNARTRVRQYPRMRQHVVAPMPMADVTDLLLLVAKQRIGESPTPGDRRNYRAAFFVDDTVGVVELQRLFAFFAEAVVYFRAGAAPPQQQLGQVRLAGIVNIVVFLRDATPLRDAALELGMFSFRFRWFFMGTGLVHSDLGTGGLIASQNVTSVEFGRSQDIRRLGLSGGEAVFIYDLWSVWLPYLSSVACNRSETINQTLEGITGDFWLQADGSVQRLTWRLQVYAGLGRYASQVSDWRSDRPFRQLRRPDQNRTAEIALEEIRTASTRFRIATVLVPPYVTLLPGNGSVSDRLSGMYVDICREVMRKLNISRDRYEFRLVDGGFGQLNGGQWSGLIGSVVEGRSQLACAPITISAARKSVVAFSRVIHASRLSILYRRASANPSLEMFQFVAPLDWKIWLTVLAALVAVAAAVWATHQLAPTPGVNFNAYNSLFFAFAEVVQGSTGDMPSRPSGRILVSFFWFFTLFLFIAYVGNYAAFRTLDGTRQEVTSLRTLLQNREFQFGVERNTITADLLRTSNYVVMQQAYTLAAESFEHGLVSSSEEAVQLIGNGSLSYRFAFISDSMQNQYLGDVNCGLVSTGEFYDLKNALVLPSDSEIRQEFDRALVAMAADILRLREKYFTVSPASRHCLDGSLASTIQRLTPAEAWPVKAGALTLTDTIGIALINVIGCCLALGLSGVERSIGRLLYMRSDGRRTNQFDEMDRNAKELVGY